MKKPAHLTEIFLHPGEYFFGDASTRVRTLLGSCVSITMWHPRLRIGGMCHYMLAERKYAAEPGAAADGRYAGDAIRLFLHDIRRTGTQPSDYQIKLFGGGNMFPRTRRRSAALVSDHNIEIGKALVRQHGFRLVAENVGGNGYRQVVFDIWSGHVWVRHVDIARAAPAEEPAMLAEAQATDERYS